MPSVAVEPLSARTPAHSIWPVSISPQWGIWALTVIATVVIGYHPYVEDAGIYVPGIKLALNPSLYGSSAAFIQAYSSLSVFAMWNAALVHICHIPLPYVLLGTQILTTWLLLTACWALGRQCFSKIETQWAALIFTSICLSVPVAGSALFLMDPYITSRSYSTPFTLLAISAVLDRRLLKAFGWLSLVVLFHPLMSIYATAFLLILLTVQQRRWAYTCGLAFGAFFIGSALTFSQRFTVESEIYRSAVATRYYYFLYRWHWYEWLGLAAPLSIIAAFCYLRRWARHDTGVELGITSVLIGLISTAISLTFSLPQAHSHFIATVQTIRPFQTIYFVLFLIVGGFLGNRFSRRSLPLWVLTIFAIATLMASIQTQVFAASAHLELPWSASKNYWVQAFDWVRMNTPIDAKFALDADYIQARGEDVQGFRAIAERDSMADYSKDGGIAAAFPGLAERWSKEHTADKRLSFISDQERIARLASFNVHWVILQSFAQTQLHCPYKNELVSVCELP